MRTSTAFIADPPVANGSGEKEGDVVRRPGAHLALGQATKHIAGRCPEGTEADETKHVRQLYATYKDGGSDL
jgi:hypothetical protein